MKTLAQVRFLGEERFSFTNDEKKEVHMMKVVLQSTENLTEVFTFNIIDEQACNHFANLTPMTEGLAEMDVKTNKKGFIDVKLKGFRIPAKKEKAV